MDLKSIRPQHHIEETGIVEDKHDQSIPDKTTLLYDIRNIISQIEEKSASGNYIYRGEPEHHEEPPYYGKICSSLYRQYARIEADEFDIETIPFKKVFKF